MDDQSAETPVPTPGSARRRNAVIGAVIAAVLVLGGVVAFALSRGDDAPASTNGGANGASSTVDPAGPGSTTAGDAGGAGTTAPDGSSPTTRKSQTGGAGSPTTAKGATGSTVPTPTSAGKTGSTAVPRTVAPGPTVPSDIAQAYSASYNARCAEIWSHAGADGELWDAVDPDYGPYTIDDCTSTLDPFWGEAMSNTVAEAHQQGIDDANEAVSSLIESGRLRNTAGYIYDIPQ